MDKHTGHAQHTQELQRLKRIEGQVRGIGKMIQEEKYCIDILTQIKAVRSAMNQLEIKTMEKHLRHCLHDALSGKEPKRAQEKIQEIIELLGKRI